MHHSIEDELVPVEDELQQAGGKAASSSSKTHIASANIRDEESLAALTSISTIKTGAAGLNSSRLPK